MVTSVNRARPHHLSVQARPVTRHAAARVRAGWKRRAGWGLAVAGGAMVPWVCVLATRLPSTTQVSHWSTAWVGLDLMLGAGLAGTGALLIRRDERYGLTASATAALLVMDAWFDVTTSAAGTERAMALGLAAGVELPLAALCAYLAARGLTPRPAGRHGRMNLT